MEMSQDASLALLRGAVAIVNNVESLQLISQTSTAAGDVVMSERDAAAAPVEIDDSVVRATATIERATLSLASPGSIDDALELGSSAVRVSERVRVELVQISHSLW